MSLFFLGAIRWPSILGQYYCTSDQRQVDKRGKEAAGHRCLAALLIGAKMMWLQPENNNTTPPTSSSTQHQQQVESSQVFQLVGMDLHRQLEGLYNNILLTTETMGREPPKREDNVRFTHNNGHRVDYDVLDLVWASWWDVLSLIDSNISSSSSSQHVANNSIIATVVEVLSAMIVVVAVALQGAVSSSSLIPPSQIINGSVTLSIETSLLKLKVVGSGEEASSLVTTRYTNTQASKAVVLLSRLQTNTSQFREGSVELSLALSLLLPPPQDDQATTTSTSKAQSVDTTRCRRELLTSFAFGMDKMCSSSDHHHTDHSSSTTNHTNDPNDCLTLRDSYLRLDSRRGSSSKDGSDNDRSLLGMFAARPLAHPILADMPFIVTLSKSTQDPVTPAQNKARQHHHMTNAPFECTAVTNEGEEGNSGSVMMVRLRLHLGTSANIIPRFTTGLPVVYLTPNTTATPLHWSNATWCLSSNTVTIVNTSVVPHDAEKDNDNYRCLAVTSYDIVGVDWKHSDTSLSTNMMPTTTVSRPQSPVKALIGTKPTSAPTSPCKKGNTPSSRNKQKRPPLSRTDSPTRLLEVALQEGRSHRKWLGESEAAGMPHLAAPPALVAFASQASLKAFLGSQQHPTQEDSTGSLPPSQTPTFTNLSQQQSSGGLLLMSCWEPPVGAPYQPHVVLGHHHVPTVDNHGEGMSQSTVLDTSLIPGMRVDPYYAVALASAGEHHHKPQQITTAQQRKKKRKADDDPTEEPPIPQTSTPSSNGVTTTTTTSSRKKASLKAELSNDAAVSTDEAGGGATGGGGEDQQMDDLVDADYDVDSTDGTHTLIAALQRATLHRTTATTTDSANNSSGKINVATPTTPYNHHGHQCLIARLQCLTAAAHTCTMMMANSNRDGGDASTTATAALATTALVHIGRTVRSFPTTQHVPLSMTLIRMGGMILSTLLLGGGGSTASACSIPLPLEKAVAVGGYWSSLLVHLHNAVFQVGMGLVKEMGVGVDMEPPLCHTDGNDTTNAQRMPNSNGNTIIQLAECIILLREVSEGQASLALIMYSVMRRLSTTTTTTPRSSGILAPGLLRRAVPLESLLLTKWWRHAASTSSSKIHSSSKVDGSEPLSFLNRVVGSKRPRADVITISDDDEDENIGRRRVAGGGVKPLTNAEDGGKRVDNSWSGELTGTELATSLYASGFKM